MFKDLASCIVVQTCAWWVPVREYPFGLITEVYLYELPLAGSLNGGYAPRKFKNQRTIYKIKTVCSVARTLPQPAKG